MSALDRGIALGKALEALLEHRAPSAEPEPLYPLSELVWRLREQGWKVVRDEHPMSTPILTEEPYVLATFETACGCKKEMFIQAPPPLQHRIPYVTVSSMRKYGEATAQDIVGTWRIFALERWNDATATYREVPR